MQGRKLCMCMQKKKKVEQKSALTSIPLCEYNCFLRRKATGDIWPDISNYAAEQHTQIKNCQFSLLWQLINMNQ